jgi:hypothetical protein
MSAAATSIDMNLLRNRFFLSTQSYGHLLTRRGEEILKAMRSCSLVTVLLSLMLSELTTVAAASPVEPDLLLPPSQNSEPVTVAVGTYIVI